jgi:hypothetical protein
LLVEAEIVKSDRLTPLMQKADEVLIENCAAHEPLFLAVGCQLSAVGQKGQGYCLRRDQ